MTTSKSPYSKIKAEADAIAQTLKACERREMPTVKYASKIMAARDKPVLKFAIAMDDKIISIEISWEKIEATSEVALSAYIMKVMRGRLDS